jgi:hypothetical protein
VRCGFTDRGAGGLSRKRKEHEMDGILGTRRIERPRYAWVAVGLQLVTGLLAIPVGLDMVRNPDGAPLGLPQAWIDATAFGSWLVPGLFLLVMNGVGQLLAAALTVVRHPLAPWLTGSLGIGLMIWIAVQVILLPFHPLQPVMFGIGLVEAVIAAAWLRGTASAWSARR